MLADSGGSTQHTEEDEGPENMFEKEEGEDSEGEKMTDVGMSSEDSTYFENEEKVFTNYMYMNAFLQVLQISILVIAGLLSDWAHISAMVQLDPKSDVMTKFVYHFTLFKMSVTNQDNFNLYNLNGESVWLGDLTHEC
jgi:hypothetical protein